MRRRPIQKLFKSAVCPLLIRAQTAVTELESADRGLHGRREAVDRNRVHCGSHQLATLGAEFLVATVAIKNRLGPLDPVDQQHGLALLPVNEDVDCVAGLVVVVEVNKRFLIELDLLVETHSEKDRRAQGLLHFAVFECGVVATVRGGRWRRGLEQAHVAAF